MPVAEIAVTLGGVGAIAFLAWFFFGPRQAQPEDMANAALFLASSDSDYMTGSVICIDGGNGALFSGFSLE